MKPANHSSWHAALTRASVTALLGLLGGFTAPSANAVPCDSGTYCSPSDPGAYRMHFDVTSTTPVAITQIVDMWGGSKAADGQGVFNFGSPPSLVTGSGRLDAGIWLGEDAHFLLGMAGPDLVIMMNPATAALMTGQPFDYLINGIPPVATPNPTPFTGAEAFIINRLTTQPAEWDHDIWSLFDTIYRPAALDPTVLIGPGPHATAVLMSFTDGKVLGTVNISVSPVPEPGSWAMVLAGLACLALITLRRRHAR